jgi:uncharacterized protein
MATFNRLKQYLKQYTANGIVLAFAGGTTGALLLAVLESLLAEACFPVMALTIHSIFSNPEELESLKIAAAGAGVRLKLLAYDPIALQNFRYELHDRLNWRREYIFSELLVYTADNSINTLVEGTTADDCECSSFNDHNLVRSRICSPLVELGITKDEVAELVKQLGLKSPIAVELP